MITRITNWFLAGLLVLVLWHADTQAQQETWERHIHAGLAAQQQGNFSEAVKQLKAALEATKSFGPADLRLATTLNNLAVLYDEQGRYAEAEPLYKRALAIMEQALGPEHPDVATNLDNLASLYLFQGKYAEAEPLYKRLLAITEKALGPEHPDVATSLERYAALLRQTGRTAEADSFEVRANAIRANLRGQSR